MQMVHVEDHAEHPQHAAEAARGRLRVHQRGPEVDRHLGQPVPVDRHLRHRRDARALRGVRLARAQPARLRDRLRRLPRALHLRRQPGDHHERRVRLGQDREHEADLPLHGRDRGLALGGREGRRRRLVGDGGRTEVASSDHLRARGVRQRRRRRCATTTSSRFGKLVTVHFDGWGKITGSHTKVRHQLTGRRRRRRRHRRHTTSSTTSHHPHLVSCFDFSRRLASRRRPRTRHAARNSAQFLNSSARFRVRRNSDGASRERVPSPPRAQRNYHIFYQMLTASAAERAPRKLGSPNDLLGSCIHPPAAPSAEGIDDAKSSRRLSLDAPTIRRASQRMNLHERSSGLPFSHFFSWRPDQGHGSSRRSTFGSALRTPGSVKEELSAARRRGAR